MNYDVDYFIEKFEAIPEEKWCINELIAEGGRRCAFGHCATDLSEPQSWGRSFCDESEAFNELDIKYFNADNLLCSKGLTSINDGKHPDYKQPTPKQRILAALKDIKKFQDGDAGNKTKPIIETTQQFKEVTFEKIKETINIKQSVN